MVSARPRPAQAGQKRAAATTDLVHVYPLAVILDFQNVLFAMEAFDVLGGANVGMFPEG